MSFIVLGYWDYSEMRARDYSGLYTAIIMSYVASNLEVYALVQRESRENDNLNLETRFRQALRIYFKQNVVLVGVSAT